MPNAISSLSPDKQILRTKDQPSVNDTSKIAFASEPEFETAGRDLEPLAWVAGSAEVRGSSDAGCPHLASDPAGHRAECPDPSARSVGPVQNRVSFREGSKAAEVCTLLCRPEGVTVREIMTATGWQAHTVRGFLSRSFRNTPRQSVRLSAMANACTARNLKVNLIAQPRHQDETKDAQFWRRPVANANLGSER
jgi:hypothetical protein